MRGRAGAHEKDSRQAGRRVSDVRRGRVGVFISDRDRSPHGRCQAARLRDHAACDGGVARHSGAGAIGTARRVA